MIYGQHRLTIPSYEEYSSPQLAMMIKEVESITGEPLSVEYWEHLKSA